MRLRQTLGVLLGFLALVTSSDTTRSQQSTSSLHTEFGEVHLQNLAIGKTYSVARIASEQFVVSNTGDDSLFVRVEAVIPAQHQLRAHALPVPDRDWFQVDLLSRDVRRVRDTQRHRLLFTVEMDPEDDTEWMFSRRTLHHLPRMQ